MKYLITLWTAIKNGILRIFPKASHSVSDSHSILPFTGRAFVKTAIAFAIAIAIIGCGTQRHVTQLVHDIQRDTIYISNVKHDSVYLNHERLIDRSKDTVYIKDVSVEYKYRLLRDTVKVVQRDSIPYEVVRIETKEITRPLTWYDQLTRLSFWFLIGSLLTFIIIKLKSVF